MGREKASLSRQDLQEVGDAPLVALRREHQRPAVRLHHLPQRVAPGLLGMVGDEGIIHFLERLQHGLLERDRRLLLLLLAQPNIRADAAALKDRQRDARAETVSPRVPVAEILELQRLDREAARQSDLWVEIRLRDADRGRGGVELVLGLPDVGPPLRELRWYADRHHGRRRRDRRWRCQFRRERAGCLAEQEAERVDELTFLLHDLGHLALDASDRGLRVRNIEISTDAAALALRRERQALACRGEVLARDLFRALGTAELDIVARDLSHRRDQRVPAGFGRRLRPAHGPALSPGVPCPTRRVPRRHRSRIGTG